MEYIVNQCAKEVGWMCTVKDLGDNQFYIDQIYLPSQMVTHTETDIDPDSLAEVYMEIANNGGDPSTMYAWFHSHVDMEVSPSPQDEKQAEIFLQTLPVLIRGIMNKQGAMKVDVYLRDQGIAFTRVAVLIDHPTLSTEEKTALDTLIKARVKEQPPVVYYGGNPYSRNNTVNRETQSNRNSYQHPLDDSLDDSWLNCDCDGCGTVFHHRDLTTIPPGQMVRGVINASPMLEFYCDDCMEAYKQPDMEQTQSLQNVPSNTFIYNDS